VDYRDHLELLLVEDSPADVQLLEQLLGRSDVCPYGLRSVSTIADAEALVVAEQIDCVLLDLSLPDSEGIESVRRMHAWAPAIPIVVLTGRNDGDLGLEAIRAGAQDYLVKGQPNGNSVLRCVRWAAARMQAAGLSAPKDDDRWSTDETAALLDQVAAPVAHLGPDLSIICVNPAFEDLVGYDQHDLAGASFSDLLEVDDLIGVVLGLRSVLADEVPAHRSRVILRHQGGGSSECQVVVSRVEGKGGGHDSLLAVICDVD
jgi:PAS domain S-box-containing protein